MAGPTDRRAALRTVPGRAATVSVLEGSDDNLCTCCEPRNPLVMRPDLGTLVDGSAEYALCVLHEPRPVVYRNRGDGVYIQTPSLSLNAAGDLVNGAGEVVARVGADSFQRLTTIDDEEAGGGGSGDVGPADSQSDRASQPRTFHVDLTQDDFY